jgi:hypothetical protein
VPHLSLLSAATITTFTTFTTHTLAVLSDDERAGADSPVSGAANCDWRNRCAEFCDAGALRQGQLVCLAGFPNQLRSFKFCEVSLPCATLTFRRRRRHFRMICGGEFSMRALTQPRSIFKGGSGFAMSWDLTTWSGARAGWLRAWRVVSHVAVVRADHVADRSGERVVGEFAMAVRDRVMVEVVVRWRGAEAVVITEQMLREQADVVALRLGLEPGSDDAAAVIWRLLDDIEELKRLCGSWKDVSCASRFYVRGD